MTRMLDGLAGQQTVGRRDATQVRGDVRRRSRLHKWAGEHLRLPTRPQASRKDRLDTKRLRYVRGGVTFQAKTAS